MHANSRDTGCAVKKIGSMLVELGVLPPRDEDYSSYIAAKIAKFDPSIRSDIVDIVEWLQSHNRRPVSVFMNLCYLYDYVDWLAKVYPASNPLKVMESKIVEHLRYLEGRGLKIDRRKASFQCLRRFFARLCYRNLITENPCRLIEMPRLPKKITILSQDDFQSLTRYIKDSSSPPVEALTILLMLFWSFKTNDVIGATIQITSDHDFEIILKIAPRSYGRHFCHRAQIIKLPNHPTWLKELKKRFLKVWLVEYAKTTTSYPNQPLFLSRSHHHTRQIHCDTVIKRISAATLKVTGKKIPPKILKQTCGHIYTQNSDPSVLSTLGWSPQTAATYAWLPRQVVTSSSESTST